MHKRAETLPELFVAHWTSIFPSKTEDSLAVSSRKEWGWVGIGGLLAGLCFGVVLWAILTQYPVQEPYKSALWAASAAVVSKGIAIPVADWGAGIAREVSA